MMEETEGEEGEEMVEQEETVEEEGEEGGERGKGRGLRRAIGDVGGVWKEKDWMLVMIEVCVLDDGSETEGRMRPPLKRL